MKWKLPKILLAIVICMMLTTACQLISKQNTPKQSSTYANKQFCQFALIYINDNPDVMNGCFAFPVSVFKNMDWYWLEAAVLEKYINWQSELPFIIVDADNMQENEEAEAETEAKVEVEELAEPVLDPNQPIVYLTFDDGPGKYTDQVLDILKEEDIKATFFVLGVQVERNPLFTKRIVDEGHTIGNHTYNHDYKQIYNSFAQFAEQVIATNKIVYELTGEQMTIFRAPGGSINNLDEGYFDALYEAGFTVFDWNVDSRDSIVRNITRKQILDNIKQAILFEPTILLLHDTNGHEQSMLALRGIIDYYREQGYQFAPITTHTKPLTFNLGKKLSWNRAAVTAQQIDDFKTSLSELYD